MAKGLVDLIADLKEEEVLQTVEELLEKGEDPQQLLDECRSAVDIVGKRFENGIYFVPDLIMSGEILKGIFDIVKPKLKINAETKYLGKVLIGTVEGDIHDIGKNIVTFMLEVNGFKVFDIGVDVPPQKFVEKISEYEPDIVGMSGLLTCAGESMKKTVEAIKEAGLRNKVKIMIGGSPTDERLANYVGADAYGKDAQYAVKLAKQWLGV